MWKMQRSVLRISNFPVYFFHGILLTDFLLQKWSLIIQGRIEAAIKLLQ